MDSKIVNKCSVCGKPVIGAEIGATCQAHMGKIRSHATEAAFVPAGYIRMSKVCEAAVKAGLTIRQVVKAAGGDAATQPVLDPVFQVVYVGRGKYMHPDVLTVGFDLLRKAGTAPKAENATPAPAETPAPAKKPVNKSNKTLFKIPA